MRGVECLILKGSESGTFAVPRDWTDLARPDADHDAGIDPRRLELESLLALVEFLKYISGKRG